MKIVKSTSSFVKTFHDVVVCHCASDKIKSQDRWMIYMVMIVRTKLDKILDRFFWLSWHNGSCSIVMIAFLGSTAIFACFTGAALLAKRREYLFLGGILSSVMSTMLLMNFGSLFFGRGAFMFNVEVLWIIPPECILQSDSPIVDWQHKTNIATWYVRRLL